MWGKFENIFFLKQFFLEYLSMLLVLCVRNIYFMILDDEITEDEENIVVD